MWFRCQAAVRMRLNKDPDPPRGTEGYLGAFPAPYQAGRTEAFWACKSL